MDFYRAGDLAEALDVKRRRPNAVPLAGGTDLLVDLNFDRLRPPAVLDLSAVAELSDWSQSDGSVTVGAGLTYTRLIAELGSRLPALAAASRTVGSPQIRNRGTVGGNLGTASPAGDAIPPLLAAGTTVTLASHSGRRTLRLEEFLTGPKCNALAPGELIVSFTTPVATAPQQFCKIGTRNAMVIAVASFALVLDDRRNAVGTAVGSAAPTVVRAAAAEKFLDGALQEGGLWESRAPLDDAVTGRFADLVASAASPIDDVRGTGAYRRHALRVMARRALAWAWNDYSKART